MSNLVQQIFHHFLGTFQVKNDSTMEYEGLNMDDRVNTTHAVGVYAVIGRNVIEYNGSHIIDITVKVCSSS